MKWILVFFCVFLIFSFEVYCKEVYVHKASYDTDVATIEAGDTVYADTDLSFYECAGILEKLNFIVSKLSNGNREVRNKTGWCNFYLYLRKDGYREVRWK